jgi:glycosyltransferase involved in cell wall biosynthesis
MRVAYVCADPGVPVFGRKGSSVHVQAILRALVRRGARVDLLACRFDGEPPPDLSAAVRVHELPRVPKGEPAERERALLAANGALGAALQRLGRIDLVYERCALWSNAALEHARHCGLPAVLEVNAPLVEEQATHRVLVDRAAAERVADRQAATATVLSAVSEGVAAHLRERHPRAAERVHVIPNGVDPDRFPAGPRPDPGHPFTVGFVGTLKPWHGLPALVDAFARLRARRPEARLLIVGDGPGRVALAAELGARGLRAATELAGAVAPDEVPAMLARMDASVAPYPALERFYFSPLKVVESMAAGLPVVASAVGDVPRVIEDGRTGLLVPPGDPVALAAALAELADRPQERLRIGAAARDAVLRSHTWDAVLERVLALCGADRPAARVAA